MAGRCDRCPSAVSSRREFLAETATALTAALVAAGISDADASTLPVSFGGAVGVQGHERSYPIPAADGTTIDRDNEVILVRQAGRVFAFALACPHENAALRWRAAEQRFQCPRHESKYKPDGTFIEGRATRHMDRFAVRRDVGNVVVNVSRLIRSDQQAAEWAAAVVVI
jgi:nitrite reductase/ring-hydroxylating ferredoxin subunit